MMNKPKGMVSARCDKMFPAVLDLIPDKEGLHISGRLDRDACGLLILTDDGDLTFRLTRPEFGIKKTYFFKAFGSIQKEDVEKIERGNLPLGDGSLSKPASIRILKTEKVLECQCEIPEKKRAKCLKNPNGIVSVGEITVSEGKFHEVKQILNDIGCRIFVLKRIRIGEILLDENLKEGEYRKFTEAEKMICEKYKKMYINL